MGSLQQQSLLKGTSISKKAATTLVHQMFRTVQKKHSNEIAIFYDGM